MVREAMLWNSRNAGSQYDTIRVLYRESSDVAANALW